MKPLDWSLNSIYRRLFHNNTYLEDDYASFNVKDKIVLDIGAFKGDSAKYFLSHGAKKVICVEINKEYADLIELPNTVVINEPFNIKHLLLDHDVCKMDIEGYEAILLENNNMSYVKKPMILEVHSSYLKDRFIECGFKIIHDFKEPTENMGVYIMENY